ncbi:fatty acid-binding protein-like [Anticarsia gemmatalis]|uniref:fatty acid-binding protein-like n=1 Tax=Anticarsia gemmatalis TaxID=129554 RepID=UPI003F7721AA
MAEAIEKYIGKKYKLKSSENFDEYLKFIGVGLISRKAACAVSPISVLTRDGDQYTFTMTTTFRTIVFSFKFNEEFVEERPDGCKLTALVVLDQDNNMVHTQVESNGRKSTHVRTFTPDTLTVVTTADGWDSKCVRIYEAVP